MASAVWARVVLVASNGDEVTAWVLRGSGAPGLSAVDALARAHLAARRAGGSILLLDVCPELNELLKLVGLRREVGGEAERREESGVEEGVEPADPAV
jgi:hypothetical protein